ncbi:MAG: hypothetical protein ACOCZE_02200 [Planctomycetota bacterium]
MSISRNSFSCDLDSGLLTALRFLLPLPDPEPAGAFLLDADRDDLRLVFRAEAFFAVELAVFLLEVLLVVFLAFFELLFFFATTSLSFPRLRGGSNISGKQMQEPGEYSHWGIFVKLMLVFKRTGHRPERNKFVLPVETLLPSTLLCGQKFAERAPSAPPASAVQVW